MGYKFAPLVFSGLIPTSGGAISWRGAVDTEGVLPTVGNADGDAIVVKATNRIYIWGTGKWNDSGLDEATFGSTPNLNGVALITDDTDPVVRRIKIELEPANATNPGAVSIVAQSFAGDKTFTNDVIVQGSIDAQTSIGSSTGTLNLGDINTNLINIGDSIGAATLSVVHHATSDYNVNAIVNVASIETSPSPDDGVKVSVYTESSGTDLGRILFQETTNPTQAVIDYLSGGNLVTSATTSIQVDSETLNLIGYTTAIIDSPDVNIGQSPGTTDIIGTVTIEYNPADPTDWTPAPTHIIEAIDQLVDRFVEQEQTTKEPTGFPNRDDSEILFDDGDGITTFPTFTIQPTGVSFDFYVKGAKFTKTSAETITTTSHPAFPYSGNNYIYYDENGDLQVTDIFSSSIIQDSAFVSIVYWNSDTETHTYFAEERHGTIMDGATHAYLHTVFGARFLFGLTLENFTIGTGDVDADAQFTAAQGTIRDEDILLQISSAIEIPILYREGQLWRKKPVDSFPLIYSDSTPGSIFTGANGRLPYNQFSGGSWSLVEVQNNKYVLVHFFATNDIENGIVGIQGIAEYNSIEDARNNANTEITSLGGLPFAEFVPIGTVIFQTATTFLNTPKADVIPIDGANYVDFRGTQLYTPAGTATTHGLLSGLANDDHFQYLLTDGTRAMGGDLSLGNNDITNVQSLQLEDPGVGVNKVTLQAPTLAGDYTLTLPVDDGINHQFAKTDGSGNIAWEFPKNNADVFHASADGRSEYTTVQSAINAAEAAGAAYLSPKFVIVHGEFTEDLTISKSGIFLIGETSQENLFNRINGSLTINKLVNIPGEGATIALIYVGGLTFTKASDNFIQFTGTNHQRVKFDGCTLISTANSVLLCNNTGVGSKVTVRNCSIQTSGAAKKAITMSNGWIDIRNSIVENTASGGVAISGADSVLATLSNTEVGGQISSTIAATFVISTSSITTASGSAIATTSASYVAISNSGLSVPFGTNSVTGTGALYFADIVNGGLGGGFASTVAAVGFINDVGNLRFPNRGTISLTESLANGQNSTTLQAASSIASNFTYTLPDAVPSNNNSAIVSSITGALSYVYVTASSVGDISKTNTLALDNQAVAQNVAGLSFTPGITNSFDAQICIVRDSTYAEYNIKGVYKTASLTWEMSQEYIGDDVGITFSITAGGQMQYTSTSTGFNAVLYYRALTV